MFSQPMGHGLVVQSESKSVLVTSAIPCCYFVMQIVGLGVLMKIEYQGREVDDLKDKLRAALDANALGATARQLLCS